jgi:hypothetical protein
MEPEIVIEGVNPNGNVQAQVEDDGRCVYLYMRGEDGTGIDMRAVWVQNRVPAPPVLNVKEMEEGLPPLMPRSGCRHPGGAPALDPGRLRLVWLPEGDGVALFDGADLLAAVLPRSDEECPGYSRAAVAKAPLAWELAQAPGLSRRFVDADTYWAAWDREPNPWEELRPQQLAAYEAALGKAGRTFAIDGERWPPRALIRIDRADVTFAVTVGMALRPQPAVELATTEPQGLRRVELGVALPAACADATFRRWSEYLSGQSQLPWARYSWLGPGHTIPCDATAAAGFPAIVLAQAAASPWPSPLPPFRGDPVTLLWAVPVNASEWAAIKERGAGPVLAGLPPARYLGV